MNWSELCYADDIVILTENRELLQTYLNIYNKYLKQLNMKISLNKIKTMIVNRKYKQHNIIINKTVLEQNNIMKINIVSRFKYLGPG